MAHEACASRLGAAVRDTQLSGSLAVKFTAFVSMPLLSDGFLAPDAPFDVMQVAPQCYLHQALALQINRFAVAVVQHPRNAPTSVEEGLRLALLGRLVQDFEAAILLVRRGFRAQSRSLARSTFETAVYLSACVRAITLRGEGGKTVTFAEAFIADHDKFRAQAARELAKMTETPDELKCRLADLSVNLGSPKSINLRDVAVQVDAGDLYTALYRPLSQDSHPSVTSVDHHFVIDQQGNPTGFRIGPDYEQFEDTTMAACASILLGLKAFLEGFGEPEERDEFERLAAVYKALAEPTASAMANQSTSKS